MINIGIVGSRKYTNINKVKEAVEQCMQKYGQDNLCIISGGAEGADTHGRVVALQKGLKYIEYNPRHTKWNEHSGKPKDWYSQPYHVGNFFERNTFIAEDSDFLFAFIPEGIPSTGTMDTVKKVEKMGKSYQIIS